MARENADLWRLWGAVQTQWRRGAVGCPTGLDYAGVDAAARWLGMDMRSPRIRAGIDALEGEFLRLVRERRERG